MLYTEGSPARQPCFVLRLSARRRQYDLLCPGVNYRRALGLCERDSNWSYIMARVCEICGKGPQFGNKVSHAHNVSRRRWNVNLRSMRVTVDGVQRRVRVCASCIKAGKIIKPKARITTATA